VQVASIKTCVESAYGLRLQRLKLGYHKLLSTFAFNFNLRHYAKVENVLKQCELVAMAMVGRCRLTL